MKIDRPTVDRLAELCRLGLSDEVKTSIEKDLVRMLAFVEKLNELDTSNVEPLIFVNDDLSPLRDDVPHLEITKEEALSNAPKRDSDYFKVPKTRIRKF